MHMTTVFYTIEACMPVSQLKTSTSKQNTTRLSLYKLKITVTIMRIFQSLKTIRTLSQASSRAVSAHWKTKQENYKGETSTLLALYLSKETRL